MAKQKKVPSGGAGPGEGRERATPSGGAGPAPETNVSLMGEMDWFDDKELEGLMEGGSGDLLVMADDLQTDSGTAGPFSLVLDSVASDWQDMEGEPYEAVVAEAAYRVVKEAYGRRS